MSSKEARLSSGGALPLILVAAAMVVSLTACDPNGIPFGAVRVQGQFESPVPVSSVLEARSAGVPLPRSLITSSAGIGVVLSTLSRDDPDPPTAQLDAEGAFQVGVAPDSSDADYTMIAYDTNLGVGAEQFLGFIELPAGANESSTAWPLGGAGFGATVDLGSMAGDSGNEGTVLPGSDTDTLDAVLNADQAEVLLKAQRDNYLKTTKNRFLNRGTPFTVEPLGAAAGSTAGGCLDARARRGSDRRLRYRVDFAV